MAHQHPHHLPPAAVPDDARYEPWGMLLLALVSAIGICTAIGVLMLRALLRLHRDRLLNGDAARVQRGQSMRPLPRRGGLGGLGGLGVPNMRLVQSLKGLDCVSKPNVGEGEGGQSVREMMRGVVA